jgi:hypothetical protein
MHAYIHACIHYDRNARDKRGISLRMPIKAATAICQNEEVLCDLKELEKYIKEELNVRDFTTTVCPSLCCVSTHMYLNAYVYACMSRVYTQGCDV